MEKSAVQNGFIENPLLAVNTLLAELAQREQDVPLCRTDKRYQFDTLIALGPGDPEDTSCGIFDAWGMDISNKGIGFITQKKISPPERYRIMMPLPGDKKLFVLVQIARRVKLYGDLYKVGATFIYDDDEDGL